MRRFLRASGILRNFVTSQFRTSQRWNCYGQLIMTMDEKASQKFDRLMSRNETNVLRISETSPRTPSFFVFRHEEFQRCFAFIFCCSRSLTVITWLLKYRSEIDLQRARFENKFEFSGCFSDQKYQFIDERINPIGAKARDPRHKPSFICFSCNGYG